MRKLLDFFSQCRYEYNSAGLIFHEINITRVIRIFVNKQCLYFYYITIMLINNLVNTPTVNHFLTKLIHS